MTGQGNGSWYAAARSPGSRPERMRPCTETPRPRSRTRERRSRCKGRSCGRPGARSAASSGPATGVADQRLLERAALVVLVARSAVPRRAGHDLVVGDRPALDVDPVAEGAVAAPPTGPTPAPSLAALAAKVESSPLLSAATSSSTYTSDWSATIFASSTRGRSGRAARRAGRPCPGTPKLASVSSTRRFTAGLAPDAYATSIRGERPRSPSACRRGAASWTTSTARPRRTS